MTFILPVDENEVTILGVMASMEIVSAREFADFLDNQFKAAGNPDWFEDIRHFRKSMGAPFNYSSPSDLRFVLNEAAQADSQIWHLIPNMNRMWVNSADSLRKKLNQFHHQQLKPDLSTLFQVSTLFQQVTEGPGLEVAAWARAVRSRVQDILAGKYQGPMNPAPETIDSEAVRKIEREYETVKKEMEKRPPWGARWTGPKPSRELTLDRRTRDIYDANGVSVMHELGSISEKVTAMWLRYFPLGGEVWVDQDGATMAYIKGTPTMVGWFGPAPDEEEENIRGFVLPKEYEFTGTDIVDLETGASLSKNSDEPISNHLAALAQELKSATKLQITDYGDLFQPVDEGEPKRLARMHKGTWFAGQLPG